MNDDEILNRLKGIDPLNEDVHITPAQSAQALTLMESIMTLDVKNPSEARATVGDNPDQIPHRARRSRRRWYVTTGIGTAVTAAAVAAAVLPGLGGSSAALAWTPTPRATTEADGEAAREACAVPAGTGTQPVDAGSRSGETAVPAAPAPVPLGTLAALDMRGQGGLAVFSSGTGIVMCMLRVVDGNPVYAGKIATEASAQSSNPLSVDGGMTTGVDTDTAVSMLTGQSGTAARVEIEVPGLEVITATLVEGRFAAWWPEEPGTATNGGSSLNGSITIRAFDATGTMLSEIDWTGASKAAVSEAGTPTR